MKVRIAKKAGFCMGVRRAVNLVLSAIGKGVKPIYTYGPLIHNPQTLRLLEKLGVKILKDPEEEVPSGSCVIRAHGVPPEEKEKLARRHRVIDGTCPRVLKVQALARKAAKEGKAVLIVGDKNHAEVKGILGYCKGKGYVVGSPAEVKHLPPHKSWVVLSQTTQDPQVFKKIADEAKARFPEVKVINTICNATHIRQAEVRRLSKECEAIVVIGGRFSANTQRLAKIAREEGLKTIFAETPEDIDLNELKGISSVGVTAGASTPNWLINEVVDRLKSTLPFYRALKAFSFLGFLQSLVFSFILAGFLNFLSIKMQKVFWILPFAFFFLLFLYNFQNLRTIKKFAYYYPIKGRVIQKHKKLVIFLIIISALFSLVAGILFNPRIISLAIAIFFLAEFLKGKPLSFLVEPLFFIGLILYLYPFWNANFTFIFLEAFVLLLFVKLYFEIVYFQTDGFLPQDFFISIFNFEERGFMKLLKIFVFLGIGMALFFYKKPFLFAGMLGLWLVSYLLFQFLRKRPLGQIIYLENLALVPPFLFFLLSVAYAWF